MPGEREVRVSVVADLGLFDVVMMGLGAMIGTSIYVLLGGAALVGGVAVGWALLLNGGLVLLTAIAYVELGAVMPRAGGGYAWVKEGLPPPFGFVAGMLTWGGALTAIAVSALGLAAFLGYGLRVNGISLLNDPTELALYHDAFRPSEKAIAALAVAAFIGLNLRAPTRRGPGIVHFLKVALLVLLVAIGVAAALPVHDPSRFAAAPPSGLGSVVLAMGVTFVAFEGYEVIAGASEEVRDPRHTLPRAMLIAVLFVTAVYSLLFVAAVDLVHVEPGLCDAPWSCLGPGVEPELGLVRVTAGLGTGPLIVMLTAGIAATAAGVFFNAASSARAAVVLSRDGILPGPLGRTWRDGRTPVNALVAAFVIALLLVLALDVFELALASGVFFLLLFALVNVAFLRLRRRHPGLPWRFRSPAVRAVPAIAAALSVALAVSLALSPSIVQGGGTGSGLVAWYVVLLWLGVGLVYHYFAGGKKLLEEEHAERIEVLLGRPDAFERERYRVFLPLKGFEDEDLVRLGARIARARGGELSLLNVVEVPANLPPKALRFSYVDARIKGLQRLAREARTLDVDARATVKIGRQTHEIVLETMQEEAVNLLVLGMPRGRAADALGSTTDALVAGAPCDVAVAKVAGMKATLDRIGVVLGPWPSTHLEELARALVAPGGHIHFLGLAEPETAANLRAEGEKAVVDCLEAGVQASYAELGPLSADTIKGISERDYDLLLFGSPPPKAFARALPLISQVRRLACPLVVFRPAPS